MGVDIIDVVNSGRPVFIRSALGNVYLHVLGGNAKNTAPITLWEYVDQPNLKWFINSTDAGFYIQSAVNPNFVVHQQGSSKDNGGIVTLWDKTTHGNQDNLKVNFNSDGRGFYFIKFAHSKKCIHVNDSKVANSNPVSQGEQIDDLGYLWDIRWA
jgi:hypothetical protein